ncbi:TRAP transporter large permease subunit, partial [Klebsiella pneumoniae]|nr:TRAP transporter large permease subunit [Klebsiella pneumoniae]
YAFAVALVGWMRGGLGQVNIIGSVIFSGMSGTAIADAAGLGFAAPVHGLVTGRAGERDRRVALEKAPRFGIVGQRQSLTFRVTDEGAPAGARVPITVRRDGET